MGKAGRRKREDLTYESFDGAGCSSGLQLELAPKNESGYAGVFPTTSGKWQATVRVEREGKKVRRNVGSYDTKEEAALQRALALQGTVDVSSPAARAARSRGARRFSRPSLPDASHRRVHLSATGATSQALTSPLREVSTNTLGNSEAPMQAPVNSAASLALAALEAGPRCGCGQRWSHLRCSGCGKATARNPASAHEQDYPDEASREMAIYVEDMTDMNAQIEQMQAEHRDQMQDNARAQQALVCGLGLCV
jgi:hypothetical protein